MDNRRNVRSTRNLPLQAAHYRMRTSNEIALVGAAAKAAPEKAALGFERDEPQSDIIDPPFVARGIEQGRTGTLGNIVVEGDDFGIG